MKITKQQKIDIVMKSMFQPIPELYMAIEVEKLKIKQFYEDKAQEYQSRRHLMISGKTHNER